MNNLFLVRHGQASFGQANYDKLSETGERQCRLLGDYWVRRSLKFDAVYSGTLERQRKSLAMIREAYAEAGLDFPAPTEMPEFNEFDAVRFLASAIPDLRRNHPDIMERMMKLASQDRTNLEKNYELVYARVMALWRSGELAVTGMDSWPEFNDRVGRGLDRVMAEQGPGRTVLVMSSGGPISAVVQRALDTPGSVSKKQSGRINNSSVTEFRYSGAEFSLISFNETPHLNRPELVTHW